MKERLHRIKESLSRFTKIRHENPSVVTLIPPEAVGQTAKEMAIGIFPGPDIDEDDLNSLSLELVEDPKFDNLSVFVQDPKDRSQYWFRLIGIEVGVAKIGEKGIPYVDLKRYDMGRFERVPCPEKNLQIATRNISRLETELGEKDPELSSMRASVGVARYGGEKDLSLDKILNLVALEYNQIRQDYRAHNP